MKNRSRTLQLLAWSPAWSPPVLAALASIFPLDSFVVGGLFIVAFSTPILGLFATFAILRVFKQGVSGLIMGLLLAIPYVIASAIALFVIGWGSICYFLGQCH